MLQLAINAFFFVEYLPEDGQERPNHVGCLPHYLGRVVTVSNYSAVVCIYIYRVCVCVCVYIYIYT